MCWRGATSLPRQQRGGRQQLMRRDTLAQRLAGCLLQGSRALRFSRESRATWVMRTPCRQGFLFVACGNVCE